MCARGLIDSTNAIVIIKIMGKGEKLLGNEEVKKVYLGM
ncbi:MAG: hypothetical protein QG618_1044 [Thermodesulfobacteriota bacterium]|nr:hypothetical protein [Thermodesulfobacteriota bacterium]